MISLSHGGSYLVTLQSSRLAEVPNQRESFGEAVATAFTSKRSKVVPLHWACCLEKSIKMAVITITLP